MSTRRKIVFVIILAILWVIFLGFFSEADTRHARHQHLLDIQRAYDVYNVYYFNGELPKDVLIDFTETDKQMAASTRLVNGRFHIALNAKLVNDGVIAHLIMFHESCHILTWDEPEEHGDRWYSCMVGVERMGAFHRELIDAYQEEDRRLAALKKIVK